MRWLNRRYRKTNADGVYFAHQPIYGPQDSNSEPNLVERYIRTAFILKALASGDGGSLLDVGASEGYQANLARRFLGLNVVCTDLAFEAGRRAAELFDLAACQSDAHYLPFAESSFDFVTCSETLEHIPDCKMVIDEMLRLARKAVIITVPQEKPGEHEPEEVHGHINTFDASTLLYLQVRGLKVLLQPLFNRYMFRIGHMVERVRRIPHLPRFLVIALTALAVSLDRPLMAISKAYFCLGFVILKDPSAWQPHARPGYSLSEIIAWRRPYYYIQD